MYQAVEWWNNIPPEMREYPRFMVCNHDKVPLNPKTGFPGQKDDASNWLTYGDAVYFAEENNWLIGYVPRPDDPFTIIDIDYKDDRVFAPEDISNREQILEWAKANTYVEKSSSGKGFHAVVRGKIPADINKTKRGIEAYAHRGFVILTGNQISPSNQVASDDGLCAWIAQIYPAGSETGSAEGFIDWQAVQYPSQADIDLDNKLLESMSLWPNAQKIERAFMAHDLSEANGYAGGSEGDAFLVQMFLKFSTHPDREAAALRMFMQTQRWILRRHRKASNWMQYLTRTLNHSKQMLKNDEQRDAEHRFDPAAVDRFYNEAMARLEQNAAIEASVAMAKATGTLANSAQAPVASAPNPFQFFNADELRNKPPLEWALKGIFPLGGMGAIWGESGSGKSFLVLDLMQALATGKSWFGIRVKQLPVACLALEGAGGLRQRVLGWEKANEQKFSNAVMFYDGAFSLTDEKQSGELSAALNNGHGHFAGVIFIDTMNQASDGADENSSRDMGQLIKGIKDISTRTRSLVIVVHHATKSKENQSMRGHSSFQAACDGIIEVARSQTDEDVRQWMVTKSKDGSDSISRMFDFPVVHIGFDADGDALTSRSVKPQMVDMVDSSTGDVVQQMAPAERKGGSHGSGSRQSKNMHYPDAPAKSQRESDQQMADRWSGMKPQAAITQAILSISIDAKTQGKFAPNQYAAPREEVLERAIILRNYPNPAQSRKDIRKAIDAMVESGKISSKMESGKHQWLMCYEVN